MFRATASRTDGYCNIFSLKQNNCVCLIRQETVAIYKEFNVKRHYQTKHVNAYDKLAGSHSLTTAVLHADL